MAHATCSDAEVITTLPLAVVLDTTAQPADPTVPDEDCGSGDSNNAYWYQYTAPIDGSVRHLKLTLGGSGDSEATVFTGACGALTPVIVFAQYDQPCVYGDFGNGELDLVPGQTYFFLITSYNPGGEASLPWTVEVGTPSGDFCAVLTCGEVPPVITDLDIDCPARQVTITGTDFAEFVAVAVTIDGVEVTDFEIVGVTATTITLQLGYDPAFANGEYCVIVSNPGPVESNEFCATLSCPGNPGCVVTL